MPKKLKEIPTFKSEEEEREFWTENDSIEFVDWDQAESVNLPKLKSDLPKSLYNQSYGKQRKSN